ncbi:hypothetical protein FGO68_gene10952 [Halteria grandinella]|uniref:Uncharacterized protein n=1 Tax=Halteria grandinella TaxID=5974 RepID=A0A8J8P3C1_HALGN|nr:hypothetical protein FGO68_gene10952 [Halteria grandinella]
MVISLSQLDFLPSDWVSGEDEQSLLSFNHEDEYHNSPLNKYFYMSGFPAKNSLINLGSTFIYTVASFSLAVFLIGLNAISLKFLMQALFEIIFADCRN